MPLEVRDGSTTAAVKVPVSDDPFLIEGLLGGDAAALRKLMERYDRLVRFTVFRASARRAAHDPQWIDSLASETWTGFVDSVRRNPGAQPASVSAYLVRIARNVTISALRRLARHSGQEVGGSADQAEFLEAKIDNPGELAVRLEDLEKLRDCLAELPAAGREITSQLHAITERRWRDAAAALGISESTLRSRWKKILLDLRGCLARKTRGFVAPAGPDSD